jgi:aldehyde dehydrogenase (NAD+)
LAGELVPLCDASRWLARHGPRLLRPKHHGWRHRPLWLWGVHSEVQRVPFGVVLVIGTWNYPLLLPGVQAMQALAAGNVVLWKPAPGCREVSEGFCRCCYDAGVTPEALRLLDESVEAATEVIDAGVDLIVLTGAHATGVRVLQQAAQHPTPCIMELSGCDAMVVLASADLDRAARAIAFGLCFNAGATCIGPRRIFVAEQCLEPLEKKIHAQLSRRPASLAVHPAALSGVSGALREALHRGAEPIGGAVEADRVAEDRQMPPTVLTGVDDDSPVMQQDLFGPLSALRPVGDDESLVDLVHAGPYALGVSIFGSEPEARRLADHLRVGSIVINDLIAPTADPRLPFGGRGRSGFGVTRGEEGLLSMTTTRVISRRRGGLQSHLDPPAESHRQLIGGALQFEHATSWRSRLVGLRRMVRGVRLNRSERTHSGDVTR